MTEFKDPLETEPALIDGDVIEIDEHTWAIHGVIPVDGEVLLAEYGTLEEARAVLDRTAHRAAGDELADHREEQA
jgi:hypothetical protein